MEQNTITSALVALVAAVLSAAPGVHAVYNLVQTWQGPLFFDGWDFYGNYDNLTKVSSALRSCQRTALNWVETQGNAIWANQSVATATAWHT